MFMLTKENMDFYSTGIIHPCLAETQRSEGKWGRQMAKFSALKGTIFLVSVFLFKARIGTEQVALSIRKGQSHAHTQKRR